MAAVALLCASLPGDSASPKTAPRPDRKQDTAGSAAQARTREDARWLRTDADIPRRYRPLIIQAGTLCGLPEISPALVAGILEAESGFDAALSDPAKDEYGIARWTPRVLRYYLPPDRQHTVPRPPFSPEDSIAALGRMLCAVAPDLEGVPGDPGLNLAAAYRTATWIVQQQGPELRRVQPYLNRVRANVLRYSPSPDPA
ncbi:hypothetical protein [Streptomyces sp. SP18CS02]|uniref:hypothetical protein n=1 Tax=Streptomyces sp. SP18CS02 TaxID=3002531 RepID=UPI002E7659D0|nr:hypothetical protein [Streptomyces sp. SP18CS02]MEE1752177.1 hypothetical protein [Streptomyces sp. SP18CS02]